MQNSGMPFKITSVFCLPPLTQVSYINTAACKHHVGRPVLLHLPMVVFSFFLSFFCFNYTCDKLRLFKDLRILNIWWGTQKAKNSSRHRANLKNEEHETASAAVGATPVLRPRGEEPRGDVRPINGTAFCFFFFFFFKPLAQILERWTAFGVSIDILGVTLVTFPTRTRQQAASRIWGVYTEPVMWCYNHSVRPNWPHDDAGWVQSNSSPHLSLGDTDWPFGFVPGGRCPVWASRQVDFATQPANWHDPSISLAYTLVI